MYSSWKREEGEEGAGGEGGGQGRGKSWPAKRRQHTDRSCKTRRRVMGEGGEGRGAEGGGGREGVGEEKRVEKGRPLSSTTY